LDLLQLEYCDAARNFLFRSDHALGLFLIEYKESRDWNAISFCPWDVRRQEWHLM
jgi:hypothetical protein